MEEPVLVLTLGRSGGTLLKNMLDRSPSLAMASEMHIVNPMTQRFDLFESFNKLKYSHNKEKDFKELLFTNRSAGCFWRELDSHLDYKIFKDYLLNNKIENPVSFIEGILDLMAKTKGKKRWGIHYPVHPTKADLIYKWWPDSKVIYLDRHPCAIIASKLFHQSTKKRKLKYWFISPLIHYGFLLYLSINHFLSSISIKRLGSVVVVRHEDLKLAPNLTLKELCNYCNIEYSPEMNEASGKASSFDGKTQGRNIDTIYRWKNMLTTFEKNIILSLTKNSLKTFQKFNILKDKVAFYKKKS